ncbi:MAG: uracil-DNA glycosylase [Thermoprotei archaeon]|nr:uracil-DNA glycosylase [TACK group archaeon]
MYGSLGEIRYNIETCKLCPLWQTRTKAVPGEGAISGLMLIGEAPGKDEDMQGRPFVGRAGKLLESCLSAVGLSRESVYITNVVKCRPPGNRRPHPKEIAACRPYLLEEIRLVRPLAILLMGNSAAYALLGKRSVVSLRKREFAVQGVPTMVTFHPAAMLRNPALRSSFTEDLLAILQLISTKGIRS